MPPRRQADIPAKDAQAWLLPAGDANVRLFSAGRKAWGWSAGRRGWGGAERGQKWRCRKDKGLQQVSPASA